MEVRSSGSLKGNLNRILVGPLLKVFRNRGIAGGGKTGRVLIEIPYFIPAYAGLSPAHRRQGRRKRHNG